MRLIDRIAARFGFVRDTPRPIELIVFADRYEMRAAGFGSNGLHPTEPHLRSWWPEAGIRGLAMRAPQRVTISEKIAEHKTSEGRVRDILRAKQMVWGDRAVWVELG